MDRQTQNRQHIGFDTRWIGDHGIGRFAREIFARCEGLEALTLKGAPSSPVDPLRSGHWLRQHPKSIFFTPAYNAPLFQPSRSILVLHDLTHLEWKENKSLAKSLYYHWIIRPACRKAIKILTVSDYSRERIIQWAGVSDEQVVNVGNGVSDIFSPIVSAEDPNYLTSLWEDEAGGQPHYFLCVSNRRPHKNESRLLKAFAEADILPETRLVFTGNATPEIKQELEQLGLLHRVIFTGNVSDHALATLYRQATGLLFPSLYEGFGLPVLEAMASGTPVLTSKVTSLPEVAGEAAILVDPLSVTEMAEGISRLWKDESLREEFRRKGLERAKCFQWESVAARVQTVLDSL